MPRTRRIATAITATAAAASALLAAAPAATAAPAAPAASGLTLTATKYARYVRFGESDRITVAATDSTAPVTAGTITFYGDGTQVLATAHPDKNGQASLTITTAGMALGIHDVNATYASAAGGFTETFAPFTLIKNNPALQYSPRGIPRVSHRSHFHYHVTLTSPATTPTGRISIYDGRKLLGSATLTHGSATVTLSRLPRGLHTLTFQYSGNAVLNAEGWTLILLRVV